MDNSTPDLVVDYCTLWFEGNWKHCCMAHDWSYSLQTGRMEADIQLLKCVAQAGHPLMGLIMFVGVCLFGWCYYYRKQ